MYLFSIILLVILIFWWFGCHRDSINYRNSIIPERFAIPEPESSTYMPQNMSPARFNHINRWDYPGYLNEDQTFE